VNYKKAIEVIEEIKLVLPKFDEELNLAIKTMKNIDKSMRYNGIIEYRNNLIR
jgi:hypothetical protein